MKLLRYGPAGRERPGVLDRDGKIRDISSFAPDITPTTLACGLIDKVRSADLSKLPLAADDQRVGACVAEPGNFIAVGLNYADHAAETGASIPKEPILFNKARSCIVGPNDDVRIPRGSKKSDWEVELAVVIGKTASYLSEADALSYLAGYCICNDLSEREWQIERGGQWMKGKCCPTFGPLGPWLVTTDEVADPQNLSLWLELNGKKVQNGSTKTMIFSIAYLVAYISQFMILEPGDVVTTGTPPGVDLGMKPPVFLKRGDTMRLGIDGLGEQRQNVV